MHPLNKAVEDLLVRWQHARQELQDRSQALDAAVRAFAVGTGPEPIQQRQELERLRAHCDELFQRLMAAVRDAQEAGVR